MLIVQPSSKIMCPTDRSRTTGVAVIGFFCRYHFFNCFMIIINFGGVMSLVARIHSYKTSILLRNLVRLLAIASCNKITPVSYYNYRLETA